MLAPYCLVTGYVLTVACRIAGEQSLCPRPGESGQGEGIGRVYLLDNLGNVLGGLAFILVLVHFSDHFVILYFAAMANLLLAGADGRRGAENVIWPPRSATIMAALLAVMAFGDLDDVSRRLEYAGQHVLFHGTRPTEAW